MHAGILKAYVIALSAGADIDPVVVTHRSIPPVVKELHMVRPHKGPRLHALFFMQLINSRCIDRRFRRYGFPADIVQKRQCDKERKDNQAPYYLASVMHLHRLYPEAARCADRSSSLFRPS